jgi:hypothetical protein
MSPLTWTLEQLLAFWGIASIIAVMLWFIGSRAQPGPWKFFWLVPARNWAHGLWLASRGFFQVRPFEAAAVLGVPLLTLIVTTIWLIGRIARHFR